MELRGVFAPKFVFTRPTLLIDSGQSVDESVFIEKYREQLWRVHEKRARGTVRHVWMLYPYRNTPQRYGSTSVSQYDKWEIRPIRRHKPLYSGGMMHTVAGFEDGCLRLGIKAPWREFSKKKTRAAVIYLNPTAGDIRFIQKYWRDFKKVYNIPDLFLGQPSSGKMPMNATIWSEGVMCYDKKFHASIKGRIDKWYVERIPFMKMWDTQESFKHHVSIAPGFGHTLRQRSYGGPLRWLRKWNIEPHIEHGDSWKSVMEATDARYYLVYSRLESVPFDAMIAISRGSTLIAPDISLYRTLPGKKILYPARDCGSGQIAFSSTDVQFWLQNQLKRN